MPICISTRVKLKLAEKHGGVTEDEIIQCFQNLEGDYLRDPREQHDPDPPSYWFISETNQRRLLKIVFIARKMDSLDGSKVRIDIKTAYPPDAAEIELYARRGHS